MHVGSTPRGAGGRRRSQAGEEIAWAFPQRTERTERKNEHLAAILPQKRQAPGRRSSSKKDKAVAKEITQDGTSLEDALEALREAMCAPPEQQRRTRTRSIVLREKKEEYRRRSQTSSFESSEADGSNEPQPEVLGDTLLFWKEYDSAPHREVGLPAWCEEIVAPTPPPKRSPRRHGETAAKSPTRSWRVEAAIQRKKVLEEHPPDAPEASAALHVEVQLRSKERLRDLLRTGQVQRVKREMAASMPKPPPPAEQRRPSLQWDSIEGEESLASFRPNRVEKARGRALEGHGHAAEALQLMGRQRTELTKARRALEQVLDTRRESDRKMERLQQVLAKYQEPEPRKPVDINAVILNKWGLRGSSKKQSAIDRRSK
mmetsp:Transcript_72987/g.171085  ORF Transcript_72987/g.171085 Transcript_72987/m.171085 type:complete len:374 (+) Transcript_72987:26-1147(+)